MKKILAALLGAMLVFSLVACGEDSKASYKLSFSGNDTGIDAVGATTFCKLAAEKTNNSIEITSYSGAQLAGGNMSSQLELLLQGGAFDIACLSDQVLASAVPELNIVGVPFAFSSYEEVYEYMDGTGGEYFAKKLEEVGLKYLGSFSNGLVHITNNKREVHSPDDVSGLKLRVYGDTQMDMTKLMGGDGVNMSWSEVYSAMQQGTIDGHYNGWYSITSGKIPEVNKYITILNVNWGGFHFVMRMDAWNKLSEDQQTALTEAAEEACITARQNLADNEATFREQAINDYGCVVTDLTEEEVAVFKSTLQSLIDTQIATYGDEAAKAFGLK